MGRSNHESISEGVATMAKNVGAVDRIVRVIVGLILIGYAIPIGFPTTGWNGVGWIGLIPIATALIGFCPAYKIVGLSTCKR